MSKLSKDDFFSINNYIDCNWLRKLITVKYVADLKMVILTGLNDYDEIMRELWYYLDVRDIIQLSQVNHNIMLLCLRINNLVPQDIILRFNDRGLEYISKSVLRNVFKFFPNISKLDLTSDHKLGNALMELNEDNSFFNDSSNLKEFTISILNDNVLIGLSNLNSLTTLSISSFIFENFKFYHSNLTASQISTVLLIKQLIYFYWYKTISIDIFFILSTLTNLTTLSIICCALDINMISFPIIPKLTTLNLLGCYGISDRLLSSLTNLPLLTSLSIVKCTSDFNMGGWVSYLSNLTTLNLSSSEAITTNEIRNLSSINRLTHLDERS